MLICGQAPLETDDVTLDTAPSRWTILWRSPNNRSISPCHLGCNLGNRGIAMTADTASRSTLDRMDVPVGRQPFHPILVPFAIACFTGAFVTDLLYWQSVDVMWETFSDWLLTAGMIIAGLAIIAFVTDLIRGRQIRTLGWSHAVGYPIAVVLSLMNA